jgi:magnesium transporter
MDPDENTESKRTDLSVITKKVPIAPSTTTIKEIVNLLNTEKPDQFDSVNYIYIVNRDNVLRGVVSIKEVFRNSGEARLGDIMKTDLVVAREHSPQEKAALLAIKNNIKAVPIIDKNKKFLGVITSDAILNILHRESVEDLLYTAGVGKIKNFESGLVTASIADHLKSRLPWLIVGLFGGIFAATIVTGFDDLIQKMVLLAAFLPAVVYIGDAVGAQTQMIAIRSLAIDKDFAISKFIKRELLISVLIGLVIGVSAGAISQIFWGNPVLALIVTVSFIFTIITSSAIAVALPLVFEKYKVDPAIGSGPVATVIRDILNIVIYFLIALLFLGSR